ncbi:MAG: hypothetical protein JO131_01680, partial [Gammaproteobacteria bacterium]|nr:hypothetical protein [Gammaproteobacteria bacterium]
MIPKIIILNSPEIIAATANLSLRGNTKLTNNNLFYLDINDAYIHQLFPLLKVPHVKK